MYLLKPVFHQTIWGGSRLSQYISGCPNHLGHLYLVNGHRDMANHVCNAGMTLRELFSRKKAQWNMEEYSDFPLTIALVDATQNLSIQVHPDLQTAERLEGEQAGKTESWLFLEPPECGWIYAGCNCETLEQVWAAVQAKQLEMTANHFPVAKGDCVCVKDGTLHALTAGSVVYEIEYGSDLTYRFYDYGRRDEEGKVRRLDIEKAMQAIRTDRLPSIQKESEDDWISEDTYEISVLRSISCYKNQSGQLECVSVIQGSGRFDLWEIENGMSVLLEPGEQLENIDITFGIAARLRKHE